KGIRRASLISYYEDDTYDRVEVKEAEEVNDVDITVQATMRSVMQLFTKYAQESKKVTKENLLITSHIEDPSIFCDIIASYLPLKLSQRQDLLATFDTKDRLDKLIECVKSEKYL